MSSEKEIVIEKNRPRHPWGISFIGLLVIGGLASMPFLAGPPDGAQMPDMVRFLGRFHPVILHLPIGIFALILFLEIGRMFSRKPREESLAPMFFGAGSAVLAVIAGFLLYHGGSYEDNAIAERHLWGGLGFACAAILTFIVKAWNIALGTGNFVFRILLFGSVGVMGFTSHDGASMTHGPDYLVRYAPDPLRELIGLEPKPKEAPAKPLEEQIVYVDIVAPILERRCVECHREGNTKGRLRMDTYEFLVKGGREGSAIKPGSAEDSNIVFRVELPLDDPDHMPPDGKPEMEANELTVVKWWLDQGGEPDKTVADYELNDEVREAIAQLLPASVGRAVAEPVAAIDLDLPDAELIATVKTLGEDFPGGLTFESQQSSNLTFTAVSMRQGLTDENFAKLGPVIPKFVFVDLSATSITDRSVVLLAAAENLRVVRLAETSITDTTIDTLIKLQNLESINLYGTKVTDEGVAKLAALPNLKRLYLWQTDVSEETITALKKQLPECEIVTGI